MAILWIDGHVEQNSTDSCEVARLTTHLFRRHGRGINRKHIFVRQIEVHKLVPGASELVGPVPAVEFYDQAGRGLYNARLALLRRWQSAILCHDLCGNRGCSVTRQEARGVDPRSIG